jgi:preprotein translocase subunit SecA
VLIGVNDVVEAETLTGCFNEIGREVAVLDALSEAQEAELVAAAGVVGRITIATHLAGRGTDIALSDDLRAAGGLHVVIGSVMASGRLERQLFGRAGRQGDPGSFERAISLQDRGLSDGAQSFWRQVMTIFLRRGILPAFALRNIQAERDKRSRAARKQSLLREQDLARQLGYR